MNQDNWYVLFIQGFNPRSRKGCDLRRLIFQQFFHRFQSTQPQGLRQWRSKRRFETQSVSIHAAARAATKYKLKRGGGSMFQSTQPQGLRPVNFAKYITDTMFQSTQPQGLRRLWKLSLIHISEPQSTQPQGLRLTGDTGAAEPIRVSIHAAARAATEIRCSTQRTLCSFNPRSRKGCDCHALNISQRDLHVSIHAAARAATAIFSKHHPCFL